MLDERSVQRTWKRSRHRAQDSLYVGRLVGLYSPRHTSASLALDSGTSTRFLADQLGNRAPAFTLEIYAHMLPAEISSMAFADFGRPSNVTFSTSRVTAGSARTLPEEAPPDAGAQLLRAGWGGAAMSAVLETSPRA